MRWRHHLLLVVSLAAACGRGGVASTSVPAAPATTIEATPAGSELVAVDVFGTDPSTVERMLATYDDELRAFGEALIRRDETFDGDALLDELRVLGDFAYVEPALVGYFESDAMKYYLTIDIVGKGEVSRRMPFLPAPTGTYADPEGLIAAWDAYEAKVWELMQSRAMDLRRVDCPAFHCFGDHEHPELKPLADVFVARVPAHADELAAIVQNDRRTSYRAAAAFLLAYSKNGPALVKVLLAAFRDESALVRNNAMRVVAEVALHHPEIDVPVDPVLEALGYAATSDRNKAAAILDGLLQRPDSAHLHPHVARAAGAALLAMLRLEQPNNHDFAYGILRAISGRRFGERDYSGWEGWLAQVPK